MGLLNFFKKQFIDVIQWTEDRQGVLAWRFPMQDMEIQNGAKLTVRESQLALVVNEGVVADVFGPGLHTLNTKNLPLLTSLKNWDKLFESPFKTDVYFFSTREQTEQRWGTGQPVTVRDKEYGPLRIRAHGIYSYVLKDPANFYKKLSGSRDLYTVDDLAGQLGASIQSILAEALGAGETAFVDLAANQRKLSAQLEQSVGPGLVGYGLEIKSFFVESLSLPEELQAAFDKSASQRLVGDLGNYARFQAADAIGKVAANEGGLAGAGAGLGAGAAIGGLMAQSLGLGGGAGAAGLDPYQAIEKLAELQKKGAISQAEFEAKKAELLKKIG